jgi:ribosomal protein L11 methylase PrmA
LSGILEGQLPDFTRTLDKFGISIHSQRQQGEWIALLGARKTE